MTINDEYFTKIATYLLHRTRFGRSKVRISKYPTGLTREEKINLIAAELKAAYEFGKSACKVK